MSLAASLEQLSAETLACACAGERESLEQVLRVMQRPFYNLARRMLHDRSLAEDATQEALLRVVTHLSEFRGEASFTTWATRVAVNVVLDFRRGMAREARGSFELVASSLEQALAPTAVNLPTDAWLLNH